MRKLAQAGSSARGTAHPWVHLPFKLLQLWADLYAFVCKPSVKSTGTEPTSSAMHPRNIPMVTFGSYE